MSINLTQAFVFETDELESFAVILRAIIPVLFVGRDGLFVHLTEHYGWGDGTDVGARLRATPRVLELGGEFALLKPSAFYAGVEFVKTERHRFDSAEKAVGIASARGAKECPKPTRVWVAMLSDYRKDVEEGDIECSTYQELTARAMDCVMAANPEELNKRCGDGYDYAFNEFDGDIKPGYRMHYRPNGGLNRLVLSLVHVYYGK